MRANPGGTLDPDEVFGRDRLIARIWRTLETRSVVLGADRRYGKTSVINKMAHEPREGWTCVTDDLENVKSPLKFVDAVYQQTKDHLSGRQKRANRLGELLRKLTGTEFLGFKIPEQVASDWELVLNALLDDLEENVEGRFVFFWDEMPYMIQNIMDAQGEAVARHLLDVLRKRRDQVGSGLRMVFTGSIGLHHVLNSIREEGNTAAEPTNDMEKETVLPLAKEDAFELTKLLLLGEGVQAGGNNPIGFLVDRVDALPYYIHHVVDTLVNEQLSRDAGDDRTRRPRCHRGPARPLGAGALPQAPERLLWKPRAARPRDPRHGGALRHGSLPRYDRRDRAGDGRQPEPPGGPRSDRPPRGRPLPRARR